MSSPRTHTGLKRASSAPAATPISHSASKRDEPEVIPNEDAAPRIVHPTLNRIKKSMESRLADQQKSNSELTARIDYLEGCKKYMASMGDIEVKWNAEEAKGKMLEAKLKELEDEVGGKVAAWERMERRMREYVSNGSGSEEQRDEAEEAEILNVDKVEEERERDEIEVIDLDNNDQEGRIDRWLEDQHEVIQSEGGYLEHEHEDVITVD